MRFATLVVDPRVKHGPSDSGSSGYRKVADLLPYGYRVLGEVERESPSERLLIIAGADRDGWTLDSYVIPRLASGLFHAREVEVGERRAKSATDLVFVLDDREFWEAEYDTEVSVIVPTLLFLLGIEDEANWCGECSRVLIPGVPCCSAQTAD